MAAATATLNVVMSNLDRFTLFPPLEIVTGVIL
jgi:hypothetical protein